MSDTPLATDVEEKKMAEEAEVVEQPVEPEAKNADSGETTEVVERPEYSLRPALIIIAMALVGLAIGIGLSNGRGSPDAISWIKLPGDLFIRALKCVVLPLVFVNIILAVIDMMKAGKASSVGLKTIGLYLLTTVLASVTGLIFVLLFKERFTRKDIDPSAVLPEVRLVCPGEGFLGIGSNGTVACFGAEDDDTQLFQIVDEHGFLVTTTGGGVADDISFSTTLQDGIFRKLVADNIVNEFVKANFVGIITFAIVFGAASQSLATQPTKVVALLEEANRIFLLAIDWIILLTPIAVLSLIAGNIGAQTDLGSVFADIGLLMAATLLAMLFHFFVTYTLLYVFFVRQNPFRYYKYLIPAQTFAFASASSAATLPISLECVISSGEVPKSVANFVLSMGATLNMDGGAIYFPTAIVFLAIASGFGDELNAASYFLIILLSTVGSAGTAPVPSASLVLIITAFNTVFDHTGTPEAFGLILAIDWLMDRCRTTLNVTGDTIMARVVTSVAGIKDSDDTLENEAVRGESL